MGKIIYNGVEFRIGKNISLIGDMIGSGNFDNEGNVEISTLKKGCTIGIRRDTDKIWFKIASIKTSNKIAMITFAVNKTYNASYSGYGLLKAVVEFGVDGTIKTNIAPPQLIWELVTDNLNINTKDFVLAYNNDTAEIWVKNNVKWSYFSFDVLTEGHGLQRLNNLWNLYSETWEGHATSIPERYTQVESTIGTLQNPSTSIYTCRKAFSSTNIATLTVSELSPGMRQTILMFGNDNIIPVIALLIVKYNSVDVYSLLSESIIKPPTVTKENNVLTITIPYTAYDHFVFISDRKVS